MPKPRFTGKLLWELAQKKGFGLELDEEWGRLGVVFFPDGKRWTIEGANLGLNNSAAFEISKDKGYATTLLRKFGIKAPVGKVFLSAEFASSVGLEGKIEEAVLWANKLSYPVFAKPNDRGCGLLVYKITSSSELRVLANLVFEKSNSLLVEKAFEGNDYRVIVYNGVARLAYRRIPLSVVGDGESTIDELLIKKLDSFKETSGLLVAVKPTDIAIDKKLREQKLHRDVVLQKAAVVPLLDNASHNMGCSVEDCSMVMHPKFANIAVEASKIIGLDFCGVDILTKDISKSPTESDYVVLELNSAPILSLFYNLGEAQKATVEALYFDILDELWRRSK